MAIRKIRESYVPRHWTTAQRLQHYSADGWAGCRIWIGGRDPDGYGRVSRDGGFVLAHRAALELKLGRPLQPGEQACHTCDMPSCIAEEHLFVGTNQINMADMVAKRRSVFGERNPRSKLTEKQAREIFNASATSRQLAVAFNVSPSLVRQIKRKIIWQSIHGDTG